MHKHVIILTMVLIESFESFEFNGSTYEVGTELNSHLNLNIYKLSYAYSFYHNDKVELAIAVGLHMMGIKTGISGNVIKGGSEVHYIGESVRFLALSSYGLPVRLCG
jgi:hypothetical protein